MTRRLVAGIVMTAAIYPAGVSAQEMPGPAATLAPGFITRSALAVSFAGMNSGDPRFSWSARVDADVDVVSYRGGRVNFFGQYEGVLGSERRELDLNHENFHVEMSTSGRVRGVEVAAVLHHVSRHLSDRFSDRVVAWNTAGVRAIGAARHGQTSWRGSLELTKMLQHTFVDYAWHGRLVVQAERPLSERVRLTGAASGDLIGIDAGRSDRERQCGARVRGGVLVNGQKGAVELYAAYERRIDGYPLAHTRSRWIELGFTLRGR